MKSLGNRMPEKLRIAVGSDHAGFALKEKVRKYLVNQGFQVEDLGTRSADSVDYPDFAEKVATRVAAKEAKFGVLICGTGLGMAMSANKIPGIRATPVTDTISACLAREHNDANVLALGARITDEATAEKILDTWLWTPFGGGRHARRVQKIDAIDKRHHAEKTT
jgi:ribose 5-phosphate isomerase B